MSPIALARLLTPAIFNATTPLTGVLIGAALWWCCAPPSSKCAA